MVSDEVVALLSQMCDKLSEVESGLALLRQSGWPKGANRAAGSRDPAMALAKQTGRIFAASAIEVARDALTLLIQFEATDSASPPQPKKRRPKKRVQ